MKITDELINTLADVIILAESELEYRTEAAERDWSDSGEAKYLDPEVLEATRIVDAARSMLSKMQDAMTDESD